MYETIRIVGKLRPKYVIWENVKAVINKNHKHNFDKYLNTMESLGYTNYFQVLNAKDYEIPQNRERVFVVSILRVDKDICEFCKINYYNDQLVNTNSFNLCEGVFCKQAIEELNDFMFPIKKELKSRLKDILEDKVDEKYYLSEKMYKYILDLNEKQKGTKWEGRADNDMLNPNIAHALGVRSAGGNQRAGVSNFILENFDEEMKVKDFKKIITVAIIPEEERPKGNYLPRERVISKEGISRAITTNENQMPYLNDYKIRKLTPLECWRLMGFDDIDFNKAEKVNSNSQLYKQAGNSIVVNVLEAIFKELFKEEM